MNKGQIVRKGYILYLKVTGEPLDKSAYFIILNWATKNSIKGTKPLSKEFNIDLSGK